MPIEPMTYIAKRQPCQCIVMMVVDDPVAMKSGSRELAKCMREGYVIERVVTQDIRDGKVPVAICPHVPKRRGKKHAD